ncbi:hypothetical protein BpHYR1_043323 [Brachionus plicatilis]|uniref:Uncharacterized protein n=1 Tax=Brachionus plicatilis TaxID=10195 RepID=A0A3M7QI46_BRAPC|nr:hypothetical protein BpHYR1_043323 [Brachionus plicatilis]
MKILNCFSTSISIIQTKNFYSGPTRSHYSEASLDSLVENSINHVDKMDNSTNFPEPIDDFWSISEGEVYEDGSETKTFHQSRLKILKMSA